MRANHKTNAKEQARISVEQANNALQNAQDAYGKIKNDNAQVNPKNLTDDQKQAEQMEEKLRKSSFTLEDMLESMQQVQKMGPLGQVVGMIPGLGSLAGQAQAAVDSGELRRTEAIIRAMTQRERRDPTVLNGSRRRRIAAGSGTSLTEVNRLVKQFGEMQKMMKQFAGAGRRAAIPTLLGRR